MKPHSLPSAINTWCGALHVILEGVRACLAGNLSKNSSRGQSFEKDKNLNCRFAPDCTMMGDGMRNIVKYFGCK
jgi:hypothetical protein